MQNLYQFEISDYRYFFISYRFAKNRPYVSTAYFAYFANLSHTIYWFSPVFSRISPIFFNVREQGTEFYISVSSALRSFQASLSSCDESRLFPANSIPKWHKKLVHKRFENSNTTFQPCKTTPKLPFAYLRPSTKNPRTLAFFFLAAHTQRHFFSVYQRV